MIALDVAEVNLPETSAMEAQRNIEFGESRVVNHMLPAKQHMASKWKI